MTSRIDLRNGDGKTNGGVTVVTARHIHVMKDSRVLYSIVWLILSMPGKNAEIETVWVLRRQRSNKTRIFRVSRNDTDQKTLDGKGEKGAGGQDSPIIKRHPKSHLAPPLRKKVPKKATKKIEKNTREKKGSNHPHKHFLGIQNGLKLIISSIREEQSCARTTVFTKA